MAQFVDDNGILDFVDDLGVVLWVDDNGIFLGSNGVPDPTPSGTIGGGRSSSRRYVTSEKQERGFSRAYFNEMLAAERAMLAAFKASEDRKRVEQQESLKQAALAAQEALEAAQNDTAREADLAKLTRSLNAAVSARNFATSLKRASDAIAAAQAIVRNQDDEDDDEEAMMVLH